ncbi:MAG TPA: DUF2501 domain-containing protein [Rhodopila sp.]
MSVFASRGLSSAIVAFVALAVSPVPDRSAHAQLMDQLKGAVGSGQEGSSGGALGKLGASGVPSVGQAGASNTAGVLQYCIQNKYMGGGGASSVKDSLMSKLSGSGKSPNDSGFQEGSHGLLQTGNGQGYSLGGSGIKAQITQKVCDQVLQHAKSLL